MSTLDQHPESQNDALAAAGAAKMFVDFYTGTKASRPQWGQCKQVLRSGDTLVVTRLDRLGRSTKDLLTIAEWLKMESIALEVTEQHIDTTTSEGRLFFTMVAAFAEFEHDTRCSGPRSRGRGAAFS